MVFWWSELFEQFVWFPAELYLSFVLLPAVQIKINGLGVWGSSDYVFKVPEYISPISFWTIVVGSPVQS